MRTALSVVFTLCPPGPDERKTSILRSCRLDLDVDLFGLRQHGDGGGRGVDAPLRFGGRDALHPMDAGLAPQQAERLRAPDRDDGLLDARPASRRSATSAPSAGRDAPSTADTCGRDRRRRARPRRRRCPRGSPRWRRDRRAGRAASAGSCSSRGQARRSPAGRRVKVGARQRSKLGIRLAGELPSLFQFAFQPGQPIGQADDRREPGVLPAERLQLRAGPARRPGRRAAARPPPPAAAPGGAERP